MNSQPAKNNIAAASAAQAAGHSAFSATGTSGENRSSTTLSVIVPAYNEQYLIEASLNGLAVLDESPRLQQIKVSS